MIPLVMATTLFTNGPVEITAGQADFENNTLTFSEKVEIKLPKEACLKCTSACLDTDTKRLVLCGSPHNKITYIEPKLSMTCQRVITDLTNKWPIQELTAQGDVCITYDDRIVAVGDNGYYTYSSQNESILMLAAADEGGLCQLTHERGDTVKASSITFSPKHNTIAFTNPYGTFTTEPNETKVSAKSLTWDLTNHLITLAKNIRISQLNLGSFTASETLQLQQTPQRKLQTITGSGAINASLSKNQKLTAIGSFTLDNEKNILTIDGTPITFHDNHGEIEAEHATIHYNGSKPVSISLAGNIKMQNFANVDDIASDTCLHYILTDHAMLELATQMLRFWADPKKRALLYDNINNIQVSAPAITIKRDKATKKETIKGEGDVRFSFSEKELNLFKQRFKMIKHAE